MTESKNPESKGRPTPSRKQQEAANKRPLVGPKTKDSIKADRAALRKQRETARSGYFAGEEKYLPRRDQGPQRALTRDLIDSRWFTMGEILIPVMLVTVFVPAQTYLSVIMNFAVLALFFMYLVDSFIITFWVKKRLAESFGETKVEKGIWLYVAFRTMYPRFVRIPKAKVKRGSRI